MNRHIIIAAVLIFAITLKGFCQTAAINVPPIKGNVNDWESIFTTGEKKQLDSCLTAFSNKAGVGVMLATVSPKETTAEGLDAFTDAVDSVFHENNNTIDMVIFLSKEYRKLTIKAKVPSDMDADKIKQVQARVQQLFQNATQPNVPLLKEGKYAEALIAIITNLGDALKDM